MTDAATSAQETDTDWLRIPMHRCHVETVVVVTEELLEVTLGGLDAFEILGPDTFAFALISPDGAPLDPGYTIDRYQDDKVAGRIHGAYYTVRRWDPERALLTLWVVVHGHDGGLAGWMQRATRGDELLLWGPRQGFVPPADADHVLLIADPTGFAAVASIIESLDADVVVEAVLDSSGGDRPPLPKHPGLTVRWIERRSGDHLTGEALVDALGALDLSVGTWAAFGGAESHVVTKARKFLRHERGLPATHVSMTGYWRS